MTERHRIQEFFSEKILDKIKEIDQDPENIHNDMKAKKILFLLKDLGFTEIGPGTNRLAVRNVDYIYKIALDSFGVRDNWNEFNMSPELQPVVTKTYETNGIIAVAEYVNLITKQEFFDSINNIRTILEYLDQNDYLFCDVGLVAKNYLNFGFRDNGELVITDYGYIYPFDPKLRFCKKCGSRIKWNPDYTTLICTKCGKEHDPIDVRDRMWKKESQFFHRQNRDPKDNKPLELEFLM